MHIAFVKKVYIADMIMYSKEIMYVGIWRKVDFI